MLHRLNVADFMGPLEGLTNTQVLEVLDEAEKAAVDPGSIADQYRTAQIEACKAELRKRVAG